MGRYSAGSGIIPPLFCGDDMNRGCAIGCILLLIAGFVGADSISSTIMCDGASWVSSSVIGQGQTYAAHLFTTSIASIIRELQVNDGKVEAVTVADSSGPMGIDEYSGQEANQTPKKSGCVFEISENRTRIEDEIRYTGLMKSGLYTSARDLTSSETSATTMINGTGMILARASSQDQSNETTHTSDVAGRLNMTERIVFRDDE